MVRKRGRGCLGSVALRLFQLLALLHSEKLLVAERRVEVVLTHARQQPLHLPRRVGTRAESAAGDADRTQKRRDVRIVLRTSGWQLSGALWRVSVFWKYLLRAILVITRASVSELERGLYLPLAAAVGRIVCRVDGGSGTAVRYCVVQQRPPGWRYSAHNFTISRCQHTRIRGPHRTAHARWDRAAGTTRCD